MQVDRCGVVILLGSDSKALKSLGVLEDEMNSKAHQSCRWKASSDLLHQGLVLALSEIVND